MKFGLNQKTITGINGVFSKWPGIERVILYGSRAKGTYGQGSDIDLTIVGGSVTQSDLLKISGELDDLLLPYKIDVSLMHQITDQAVLEHIKRVGVVFYKREAR